MYLIFDIKVSQRKVPTSYAQKLSPRCENGTDFKMKFGYGPLLTSIVFVLIGRERALAERERLFEERYGLSSL